MNPPRPNTSCTSPRRLRLFLASAAFASVASLSAQIVWTGSESDAWTDAANWSGAGAPPDTASEVARFNAGSDHTAVSLGDPVTVGKLEFLTGAAAYTLSGSALTISAASGSTFLENSSGQNQAISTNLVLAISGSGTSTSINVGPGGSLTLSGQLSTTGSSSNRNVGLTGGGTVNLTSTSTFSGVNNLQVGSGTTLNYGVSNGAGLNNLWVSAGSRINLLANPGAARTLTIQGDGAGIYASAASLTVSSGSGTINLRGSTEGATTSFGADFAGEGTVTVSKGINLNANSSATANTTYRLYAAANNTLKLSGIIQDSQASANGTRILVTGGGVVLLSGSSDNTTATELVVEDARLDLDKTAGLHAIGTGGVTVQAGGEVRLLASHQIADTATLALDGGVFNAGAFSESLDALSVTDSGGSIDLSAGASLTFASLSSIAGTLTITGWTTESSIVFSDTSGWTTEALSQVVFAGWGEAVLSGNELIGIPEPSSMAALLGCAAGLATMSVVRRSRRA